MPEFVPTHVPRTSDPFVHNIAKQIHGFDCVAPPGVYFGQLCGDKGVYSGLLSVPKPLS